ncbi:Ascorbate ferrireductase (transmembrane) [Bertholletia excelsa]
MNGSGASMSAFAHLFAILSFILLLVWLLHHREGLDLDSDDARRVFNVHPFLMVFGFIFFAGEGAMMYRTAIADWDAKKMLHMFFHLIAMTLGIVGIYAAFKFHDQIHVEDMTSLHSWIGMGTFCLFCLQWLFGFSTFLFPKASQGTRQRAIPWHRSAGRALLYMSICAAESGLMQKEFSLQLGDSSEAYVVNFLGLAILLFGISVDFTVTLGPWGHGY